MCVLAPHQNRDPKSFHFDLPVNQRPVNAPLREKWYPAARRIARTCTSARRVDPLSGVVLIVVHATAGSSTDGAFSVMREGRASYHWLVPDEDEAAHGCHVWATAPERRAAWHVRSRCHHRDVAHGATHLNHRSLGIEIVNRQARENPDRFSMWQVRATANIIRYAWAKYPNLRHVVSHARLDPMRRTDPGQHFPWEQLEEDVLKRHLK